MDWDVALKWAQPIAIFIVAVVMAWERSKKWYYGRNDKDRRQTGNSDNGALKRIEKSLKCVDKKVGAAVIEIVEVKTIVNEQKSQCTKTVARFDEAITNQNKALLDIAMEKKG